MKGCGRAKRGSVWRAWTQTDVTRRVFLSERSNGHEATTQIKMSKPTTKDERSLLLYLETRAVDHGGKIRDANMNDLDRATLKAWTKSGYVKSGRIASEHMDAQHATWVHLSEQAMADAHDLRKARAERMWANKVYMTTDEKRSVGHGGQH